MKFIYVAQTQTGNYHHLSVSNTLSLSTRSNLFGAETECICFTTKTGIDEMILPMPFFVIFR